MKFLNLNFQLSKKSIFIILIGILVLAALLRIWDLGKVPISPDWDEAALGYNAYSILHTGKDEYGKFLPVVLRSFDDYKPALYAYLTIPSIAIFGLNVFAVRLPSAIFGIIGVLATFLLIQEIFRNSKYKDVLSLLGSFFLAISPWEIQFSRVAFESHVGMVLNLLIVLFFVKSFRRNWLLIISAALAGLNIYVYQSEKVFTPLLLLILLLIYLKDFIKIPKKYIFASLTVGIIVVLPMLFYIINNKEALLRVKGTSVFAEQTQILQASISRLERDRQSNDFTGLIFDNRRVVYFRAIIAGYVSHFNLNWLFIEGDLARHHAPGMGLMYIFELPLLLAGIYFLLFGEFDRKTKLLVFLWILITPIPASITTGVPHSIRTLNFLPTWQILIAVGAISLFLNLVKHKLLAKAIIPIFLLFALFNFIYYLNQYFVQLNYFYADQWQYGWEQAASYVKSVEGNYKKIVVTDTQPLDRGYMFMAFYLKFDPLEYQKYGIKESGGFAENHYFGKYEFRPIDWSTDSKSPNTLLVGTPLEFPSSAAALKTVSYPDGKPAIKIISR